MPPKRFRFRIGAHRLYLRPLGREAGRGMKLFGTRVGRTISLDPRYQNLVRTYVHELLHLDHPSWSETRVRHETKVRWRKLTWRDKARLYRALGKARIGEDDEEDAA